LIKLSGANRNGHPSSTKIRCLLRVLATDRPARGAVRHRDGPSERQIGLEGQARRDAERVRWWPALLRPGIGWCSPGRQVSAPPATVTSRPAAVTDLAGRRCRVAAGRWSGAIRRWSLGATTAPRPRQRARSCTRVVTSGRPERSRWQVGSPVHCRRWSARQECRHAGGRSSPPPSQNLPLIVSRAPPRVACLSRYRRVSLTTATNAISTATRATTLVNIHPLLLRTPNRVAD
jgi:hypothetical protein